VWNAARLTSAGPPLIAGLRRVKAATSRRTPDTTPVLRQSAIRLVPTETLGANGDAFLDLIEMKLSGSPDVQDT